MQAAPDCAQWGTRERIGCIGYCRLRSSTAARRGNNFIMVANLDGQLVVAISSRALFDFEEENRVFEAGHSAEAVAGIKQDAAYMTMQLDRLDVPAKPGVAFSLVKKLLAFNQAPEIPQAPWVATKHFNDSLFSSTAW